MKEGIFHLRRSQSADSTLWEMSASQNASWDDAPPPYSEHDEAVYNVQRPTTQPGHSPYSDPYFARYHSTPSFSYPSQPLHQPSQVHAQFPHDTFLPSNCWKCQNTGWKRSGRICRRCAAGAAQLNSLQTANMFISRNREGLQPASVCATCGGRSF